MEGSYRQKEGEMKKLKEWIISGKVSFHQGKVKVLPGRFLQEDEWGEVARQGGEGRKDYF